MTMEIILEGLSRQIDWEGLGICLSGTAADGQGCLEPDEG